MDDDDDVVKERDSDLVKGGHFFEWGSVQTVERVRDCLYSSKLQNGT